MKIDLTIRSISTIYEVKKHQTKAKVKVLIKLIGGYCIDKR